MEFNSITSQKYVQFTNEFYNLTGTIAPPEEFKIIQYDNIKQNMYIISSYGRVFNKTRNIELQQHVSNAGYYRIALQTNQGQTRHFSTHRLVAIHFIQKTQDDIFYCRDTVNHIDTNKLNNCFWNLEWNTRSENSQYYQNILKSTSGLISPIEFITDPNYTPSFEPSHEESRPGKYRLLDSQVHTICKCLEEGRNYSYCCRAAGIEDTEQNRNIIANIVGKRRWTDISYKYNIKEPNKLNDYSDYIIPVCEMLQQGYKIVDIVKTLHIDDVNYDRARMFVSNIKNKKSYLDISNNYSFV